MVVGKSDNVHYVWLVMHKESQESISFHVCGRSEESAKAL